LFAFAKVKVKWGERVSLRNVKCTSKNSTSVLKVKSDTNKLKENAKYECTHKSRVMKRTVKKV
jgi:hypothetical protein